MIAESRLFEMGVAERAGEVGLAVAPRAGFATPDGFHPLAVANLHRAATAVWFRLLRHDPVRVRSGRWTTTAYDPVAEQSAAALFSTRTGDAPFPGRGRGGSP